MIPYSRHTVDRVDIDAVVQVLKSDWLTTGSKVNEFEDALARYAGVSHSIAVSNGTAALLCAVNAAGIKPGDEVIVPAITFAATANCVIAMGARPVITDVDPRTLLMDVGCVARKITPRTKAIIAVEYAGHPCDYAALRKLADEHDLFLISDSCHALGAFYEGQPIGQLADATVFSFHPVKQITTGEGGAIVTNDTWLNKRIRRYKNHGIDLDLHQRRSAGTWHYEVVDLGFNYRLTDFQCALGLSQLKKLELWLERRTAIARKYNDAFAEIDAIHPLRVNPNVRHAHHLYVIQVLENEHQISRDDLFKMLREKGIGANVHYIPLNLHPFFQRHLGVKKGDYPAAESAYEKILSLPLYPSLSDEDLAFVIDSIAEIFTIAS